MIEAVFMMGGLGLVVGVGLAMASKIFYVYVDPLIVAVDDALPGAVDDEDPFGHAGDDGEEVFAIGPELADLACGGLEL